MVNAVTSFIGSLFGSSSKKPKVSLRQDQIDMLFRAERDMVSSVKWLFVNESDMSPSATQDVKIDFMKSRIKTFLEKSSFGQLINQSDDLIEQLKDSDHRIVNALSFLVSIKQNIISDYYVKHNDSIILDNGARVYYLRKFCTEPKTGYNKDAYIEATAEHYIKLLNPAIQALKEAKAVNRVSSS